MRESTNSKNLKNNEDDDLLSDISYEKSVYLKASQIISELSTEDDEPYLEKSQDKKYISNLPSFGRENYPIDENSFHQSISYWIIHRLDQLKEEKKKMSVATLQTILLFMDQANPLRYSNSKKSSEDNFFLEYLVELKKRISDYSTLVELINISIAKFPKLLKIGDEEDAYYKTLQEFKREINVVEIMATIDLAWHYSCQEEEMEVVRDFIKYINK